eukprot:Skav223960  [mRNA]  locus=scaffold3540:169498:172818:- [translate_table: standard]
MVNETFRARVARISTACICINIVGIMGDQHQVHVWENTYIMQPKVTAVIKNVMEGYLQDKEYAAEDAKAWTLDLSNEIKASVKQDLNIPRYKIIVQAQRMVVVAVPYAHHKKRHSIL